MRPLAPTPHGTLFDRLRVTFDRLASASLGGREDRRSYLIPSPRGLGTSWTGRVILVCVTSMQMTVRACNLTLCRPPGSSTEQGSLLAVLGNCAGTMTVV